MLVVSNITKRFHPTDQPILRDVSFTVNNGERLGIIGANGTGKTTLMRLMQGEIESEKGHIQFVPASLRVGYLPQGLAVDDDTPLGDVLYPKLAELEQSEALLEDLSQQMADANEDDLAEIMSEYGQVLADIERLSQEIQPGSGETILAGLDLAQFDLATPVGILSGGQKTRLGLAALLLKRPQLILLDEPTNHLDITALEWLETWLAEFDGGVIIISHDRTFLDKTVNTILAIDAHTQTARLYPGTYRDYVERVQSERDKHWAEWRDQQVEIARLQYDMERTMARAVRKENATKNDQQRRYAKKVAKRAKAKETRLKRYLASEDRVEKPPQTWQLKLDFGELPPTGHDVIDLHDVSVGYAPHPPLLHDLNLTVRGGERVALLGQNGKGKSTLIKTILREIPVLNGDIRIGASIQVGYLAQEQDFLKPDQDVLHHLRSEVRMSETEARSFLHYFLFSGEDVFQPVAQLSYGERTRLMLAILVARGSNLLILDEPINHLDIPSRELFEQALSAFKGSILAVVHDRYFVDKFATTIWQIEDKTIKVEITQPMLA